MSDLAQAVKLATARAQAASLSNLDDVELSLLFVGFDIEQDEVADLIERHAVAMATKIAQGLSWGACLRGLYAQGLLAGLLVGQLREERQAQEARR